MRTTLASTQLWRRHREAIILAAITALGAALRLYANGSKSLWLDEAFSIWVGSQPLTEAWGWLIRVDQHPPLYYTLLHFWMAFGQTESVVRSFSALCGVLTLPVVYLIGRWLGGTLLGIVAVLILVISPFHVAFGQETRMYALLTLNASLAIYFLIRLLQDPVAATQPIGVQFAAYWRAWRRSRQVARSEPDRPEEPATTGGRFGYREDVRRRGDLMAGARAARLPPLNSMSTDLSWLGYMLFTGLSVLTHNTAVFLPVAVNLFVFGLVLWERLRQRRGFPSPGDEVGVSLTPRFVHNWLWAQFGAFLIWSPWLVAFVDQSIRVYEEFWIPKPTWRTVLATWRDYNSMFQWDRVPLAWLWNGLLLLAVALGVLGFVRRRQARWAVLLLLLWLVPWAGELLVSLKRPIFYTRTLIWASVPYYLLIAAGIRQLRYLPYQIVVVAVIVILNTTSLGTYYFAFQKEGWDQAAAYVASKAEANDVILFNATWVQIPFDYYFRRHNRPVEEHGVPVDLFDRGILEPKMRPEDLPRLRQLIRGRDRVWLVYSHDWYTDPQKLIPAALNEELARLDTRRFRGLQVLLYGVR
ncbi:MAG TPA: hypothetical protein EYP04_08720 [Anaerolineae bacterium]|nr:hypothetical protein [Anaerolineae bacterium]HIQ04835.1 hypothetical protein [Anaerolineae bacterium]